MNMLMADAGPITDLTGETRAVKPTCKGVMRDYDIRLTLRQHLKSAHEAEPGTVVIDELGLCQGEVRVDMAVVNGLLSGYEIKSDSDTLARLPRQANTYNRVFDRITIVCGTSHLRDVRKSVPRWWGISVAVETDGTVELREVRSAKANKKIDMTAAIQLLWKGETAAILEMEGLEFSRRWSTYRLWETAVSQIEPHRLASLIREAIKGRGDWRSVPRRNSDDGSPRPAAKSLHSQAHTLLARIHQCSCLHD